MVETDPDDSEARRQRAIPRHVISKIERGEHDGATEGLQTESALARKVISGTGFRDEEGPKTKEPKVKKDDKKDAAKKEEKKDDKKDAVKKDEKKAPPKKDDKTKTDKKEDDKKKQ